MPFKKNIEREELLLSYWNYGQTVKETSLITGIPAGSISHYFARFNKKKNEYREKKIFSQEPPRPSSQYVAQMTLLYTRVFQDVGRCIKNDDFQKARDILQTQLLWMEWHNKMSTVIQAADPEKWIEVLKEYVNLLQFFD